MTIIVAKYDSASALGCSVSVDVQDKTPRAITPFVCHRVGRQWWRLGADFLWFDGHNLIRMRKGYGWNGASVPAIARWYVSPGDYLAASCIHDYGYGYHWLEILDHKTLQWECMIVDRSTMDSYWFQLLRHMYGVNEVRTSVLWGAVHLFGNGAYWSDYCRCDCRTCSNDQSHDCPYFPSAPIPYREIEK